MGNTLAIMVTVTTRGSWMRGDKRGWIEDGVIRTADPELEERDRARMGDSDFRFDRNQLSTVGEFIGRSLTERMNLSILALTVQTWHVHFVIAATHHPIDRVVKCAKDAVRYGLRPGRPIWTTGYDKRFCFDVPSVRRRIAYVERHNLEIGFDPRPWDFIAPYLAPGH